jgi:ATP-dependent Zn protease
MRYQYFEQLRKRRLAQGARLWSEDGDMRAAAHEGGHILAAERLGLNPVFATIEPGAGYDGLTTLGDVDDERAFERAIVLMAGDAAEKLLLGEDYTNSNRTDLAEARALFPDDDDIDNTIRKARRRANILLRENFIELTRLAVALIKKRSLDESEIADIIEADGDNERDADDDDAMQAAFLDAISDTRMVRHAAPEPFAITPYRRLVKYG